jgi:hypothetical protein
LETDLETSREVQRTRDGALSKLMAQLIEAKQMWRQTDFIPDDYQWSTEYSRSIAVDIRYVLWVVEKFAGAGTLLQELGVK